ncbi:MAG: dynamin family protein [Aggregatilineales bacterium]
MAAEQTKDLDTRLATDYEAIRRREYELITDLLEFLPRVDNLPPERVAQVRDALFHADHPFLMVFVGPFSSGKSSLINALVGKPDLLKVGVVPTTDRISILRWGEDAQRAATGGDVETVFYPSPLLKKVSFVDTPGLESVFTTHEETTRKFLHRSDVVLLVMLATQAMTARNLEYLQRLSDYGKKVIIVINQVDLLTPEEAQTVRDYVLDQSQAWLGYAPEVWLMSARQGLAARSSGSVDQTAWEASGLHRIEAYVDEQLSDADRLRQKLSTPLQITRNVSQAALEALRANQAALDTYQNIAENIERQLEAQKRELDRVVRDTTLRISEKFGEAAMRGSEAIRDVFRLGRAGLSLLRGFAELVGLGRLTRGASGVSYVHSAFERHKAFAPVDELADVVAKLGPQLEGKDIQDIDDLVKYAQREIDGLPPAIRAKVIGAVQAPLQYDRSPLAKVRAELETLENTAREDESERLDRAARNTLLYLVVYEILLLLFGFFFLQVLPPEQAPVALVLVLGLMLLGLAALPLRGRALEAAYTRRMLALQAQYIKAVSKAAERQIAYGMQLRREAIAPLTRLIEAQTQIQTEQLTRLQAAEREMVNIEMALTAMGKRSFLSR